MSTATQPISDPLAGFDPDKFMQARSAPTVAKSTAPATTDKSDAKPDPLKDFDPDAFMAARKVAPQGSIGDHISAFVDGLKTAPILHPIDAIGSMISMARHPIDTISSVGAGVLHGGEEAVDSAKKGDYVPAAIHAGLGLIPFVGPAIDQHYQAMKDAEAKGDTVTMAKEAGALMGIGGSAELARRAPDVIKSVPTAASTVGDAASKVADVAGSVGTGVKAAAPGIAGGMAMAGAGELLSQVPGMEWPARIGMGYPAARMIAGSIKQGIAATVADLAAKRAKAASALSDLQNAQQSAADAFKGEPIPTDRQLPPAPSVISAGPVAAPPDTSGPIPTDPVTGRPLDRVAPQEPLPVSRQLAAPSGPPPIIAGPITPTPIENPPPMAETAPSAAATPSPVPVQSAPVAAPVTPAGTPELVSLDAIAKGINGGKFENLSPQQKAMAQQAYDEIHAVPTPAPKPVPNATSPTPASSAYTGGGSEGNAPSDATPVSGNQETASSEIAASRASETSQENPSTEESEATPAPTSRVVNLPSASGFGPAKIITEEGLSKYAQDNGVTEDQGRQMLQGDGYQIIGRSGLNRALHGIGTELDMDHDMLSDVAKIQFRVKSMSQLSQEDMLQLYQDLQEKRAVNNPMLGKGELADKFQGRSSAPETAYTSQPQVGPPAPTAPVRQPRGFDELNAQMTESLRNRAPQSVAPAQALKAALEQSPESSTIGQGKTNGIGQGSAGATAEGASATKPIPSSFNASSPAATEVLIPGEGRSFPAKYSVKELNDIQASHGGLTFQPNPKYSLTNDRDYKSADNQGKVVQGALPGQFKPAFHITDNPDATNGPPLIDSQGNVIGGNGRTMTLQRVYQYNPAGAQAYKDLLTQKAGQFGIDPTQIAGMKRPVLVRQISDQDLGNSQNAVTDFNKTGTAELRPAERSIADSRRVSQSTLDDIGGKLQDAGADSTLTDVLKGKSGSEVLNKLIDDGVISPQERAKYASGDTLTPDGQQRISKLLVGRFFRDPAQIDTIPTTIKNKIERIAAPLASLEDKGEWSLTPQVQQGLDLLEDARAHGGGKNLDMFVKQNSLLSSQSYSPEAIAMAKTLQAMPQRQLVSAIAHYVEDAAHYSQGPDLFGTAPKSPAESLAEALSYAKQ